MVFSFFQKIRASSKQPTVKRIPSRIFGGKTSTAFLTMKKELPQIRAARKRASFGRKRFAVSFMVS